MVTHYQVSVLAFPNCFWVLQLFIVFAKLINWTALHKGPEAIVNRRGAMIRSSMESSRRLTVKTHTILISNRNFVQKLLLNIFLVFTYFQFRAFQGNPFTRGRGQMPQCPALQYGPRSKAKVMGFAKIIRDLLFYMLQSSKLSILRYHDPFNCFTEWLK